MRGMATLVLVAVVGYIAALGISSCAAPKLAEVIHGPAPQITEYNTYDNSRETHVLSDNTVKFFSDLKLLSDNKKDSDNTYATTNNTTNNMPRTNSTGNPAAALILFMVGMLAMMTVGSRL